MKNKDYEAAKAASVKKGFELRLCEGFGHRGLEAAKNSSYLYHPWNSPGSGNNCGAWLNRLNLIITQSEKEINFSLPVPFHSLSQGSPWFPKINQLNAPSNNQGQESLFG